MRRATLIGALFALMLAPLHGAGNDSLESLEHLLDLRGFMRIGGEIEFSIYNKDEKRSEWLRLDEPRNGYTVKSYDPKQRVVVVRYQNLVGTLSFHGSQISRYVEPVPEATPTTGRDRAPTNNRNDSSRSIVDESGRQDRTAARSSTPDSTTGRQTGGEQGAFLASSSRPVNPPSSRPPSSGPRPVLPDLEDDSGDDENGFSWRSLGTPPPPPPSPPPAYSPR